MPDTSRLLALIGSIYDSVIEPQRWQETVAALQRHVRMHSAVLGVNSLQRGAAGSFVVSSNIPDAFWSVAAMHEQDMLKLWGGPERIARLPLEEPVVQSRVTDRADWAANVYYREFVEPQGLIDAVAIGLERDSSMVANFALGRHASEGEVGEVELDQLRMIAPHLRRATTIGGLLDGAIAEASTFAAMLEASPAGIVLVDEQMCVLHANRAAQAMIAAGDPIKLNDRLLSIRQELVPGQLEAAVAAVSTDDISGRRGLGIPARSLDGTACVLHVLPLERREIRGGLPLRARAAIFVSEVPRPLHLPLDAVTVLYSLTPAEARVFDLVAQGLSLNAISVQLGISANTVRTHLNRVFDKTGCHRQADLVALARSISLPA